jgi:gas vesicle protein
MVRQKMIYEYPKYKSPPNHALGVLAGMLIGALVGALAMVLMAPQSGKETRTQIQNKGIALRAQTTGMVQDTLTQVRSKANEITIGAKDYSQELAIEQLDQVSEAAKTAKKAIQGSG